MDAEAAADQLPAPSRLGGRVPESWKPLQGGGQRPPVFEMYHQRVRASGALTIKDFMPALQKRGRVLPRQLLHQAATEDFMHTMSVDT